MAEEIKLPECEINYMESLWKAKKISQDGEPKHSCVLTFDAGTDLTALTALMKKELTAKFGDNIPPKAKWPLKPGEEMFPGKDDFKGKMCLSSATEEQPNMVRVLNGEYVPIIDHSQLYSGCRVVAFVGISAYNMDVNKGVGVYVNGVLKIADGDHKGGGTRDAGAMFGSASDKADTPTEEAAPGGAAADATADAGTSKPDAANPWDA